MDTPVPEDSRVRLSPSILILFLVSTALAADEISYNEHVRPILAANCFKCHGPDEAERQGNTRLDIARAADLDEVKRRITSTDPEAVMPPPSSNKTLSDEQISTLQKWMAGGAQYAQHWSFVVPTRPIPPNVHAHPIDAFVRTQIDREASSPAASRADAYTLVRRLHLDLIGLPPPIAVADAFAADPSEHAYQALVDRLLASPRYGERWARRWLDLARYADTNGYEKDRDRTIWPYRDWVIRAINADQPFDEFTIEQLAGDMIPNARPEQVVATGFHRNTMLNEEGGIDPQEFHFHAMTDRVATTGTVWLGLTTGCAQCHTHKYDPITHRDYYGMMAYLNNADEPDFHLPQVDGARQRRERLAASERLISALPEKWPLPVRSGEFHVVHPSRISTEGSSIAALSDDGTISVSGPAPPRDTYTLEIETAETTVQSLRISVLTDDGRGPGRTPHGNFVLSEIEIVAVPLNDETAPPQAISIATATATAEQPMYPIAAAFDGELKTGWGIHVPNEPVRRNCSATFTFTAPLGFSGGTRLTVKLIQNLGGQHTIGSFRLSLGTSTTATPNLDRSRLVEQGFAAWLERESKRASDWRPIVPHELRANIPFLEHEGDGVVFAGGDTSKHDIYELSYAAASHPVRTIRLDALPDERLPAGGPGMTFYEGRKGDFYLTEFLVRSGGKLVPIASASVPETIDGDIQTGWSGKESIGRRRAISFLLKDTIPAGQAFSVEIHFGRHYSASLGKFRLTTATEETRAGTLPVEVDRLLSRRGENPGSLSSVERTRLRRAFLLEAPELEAHSRHIKKLQSAQRGPATLVLRERPESHPRTTYLRHRGEYTEPRERVAPRLPDALVNSDHRRPENRLEFAQWLVSPENPLTARVVVNRHWAAFFGTGIVPTLADFGLQGAPPSNPDLLDWLATFLTENNWSIKSLHRHVVTSEYYRQTSQVDRRDVNQAPSRFPRQRLEAEIIRDAALAAAGVLRTQMFGPPVRPPQPDGITEAAWGGKSWTASTGSQRFRRSLYTYQKRTAPFAMFTTFDAGSGESCLARRDRSNTPLQALTLLNDPMFVEIAEKFGERLGAMEGSVESRVGVAFRSLLTRPPAPRELAALSAFYQKHQNWSALARGLLSLDEFITKN